MVPLLRREAHSYEDSTRVCEDDSHSLRYLYIATSTNSGASRSYWGERNAVKKTAIIRSREVMVAGATLKF